MLETGESDKQKQSIPKGRLCLEASQANHALVSVLQLVEVRRNIVLPERPADPVLRH